MVFARIGYTAFQQCRRGHAAVKTVDIKAGNQTLTAADPLPDDLRTALIKIRADGVH